MLDLLDADILFVGSQCVTGPESGAVDDVGLVQSRLIVAGAFDDAVRPGMALVSLVDPPLEQPIGGLGEDQFCPLPHLLGATSDFQQFVGVSRGVVSIEVVPLQQLSSFNNWSAQQSIDYSLGPDVVQG